MDSWRLHLVLHDSSGWSPYLPVQADSRGMGPFHPRQSLLYQDSHCGDDYILHQRCDGHRNFVLATPIGLETEYR